MTWCVDILCSIIVFLQRSLNIFQISNVQKNNRYYIPHFIYDLRHLDVFQNYKNDFIQLASHDITDSCNWILFSFRLDLLTDIQE